MRRTLLLAALTIAAAFCGGGSDGGGGGAETTTLTVISDDGQRAELTVELAVTPSERSQGLMGRKELPEDAGMLFVFAGDTQTGFWMKDTLIPLSIAFIAADGSIVDIQDMEPLSDTVHQSPQPFRYALEANEGWFERHGFAAGDRVEGLEGIAVE